MRKIILIITLLALIPLAPQVLAPFKGGLLRAQTDEAGTKRDAHLIVRDSLIKGTVDWIQILRPDGTNLAGRYLYVKLTKIDTSSTPLDSMTVVNKNKFGDSVYVSVIGAERTDSEFLTAKTGTSYDLIFDPFIWALYIKFGDANAAAGTMVIITTEAVEK